MTHTEVRTRLLERDVVLAEGPEAATYLHSQVSQDVEDMVVGDSRLTFLLQPQGKIDALLRITRTGDETFVLDTDAGHGEAMTASLARFKLRTKVEFTPLEWGVSALVGDDASSAADGASGVEVVVSSLLGDEHGVDLLGPAPVLTGAAELSADDYERLRVEVGFPIMGVDIDEGAIPNESGLVDRAVSFTKGCYRGQELVERIHARGGNRQLLRVLVASDGVPVVGSTVRAGDRDVGRVTSVAGGDPVLAMAYVRGDVEQDEPLTVVHDDAGPLAARLR